MNAPEPHSPPHSAFYDTAGQQRPPSHALNLRGANMLRGQASKCGMLWIQSKKSWTVTLKAFCTRSGM